MGCFDATCAVTRTAIAPGDEVLMVGVRFLHNASTYDLHSTLWRHRTEREKGEDIGSMFIKGLRDMAKSKNKKVAAEAKKSLKAISEQKRTDPCASDFRYLTVGKYNHYGSVEGSKIDLDKDIPSTDCWWDYQFMVHKDVAEELVGYKLTKNNLSRAVEDLCDAAQRARIQLFGHNLLGEQDYTSEELKFQRKVLDITKRKIADRQKRLDRYKDY